MRFRTGVGLLAFALAGAMLAAPAPAGAETVTKTDSVAGDAPPQTAVQAMVLHMPAMLELRYLKLDMAKVAVQDDGSPVTLSLRSVTAFHAQMIHATALPRLENRTRASTVDIMPAMSLMLNRSEPLARQRSSIARTPVGTGLPSAASDSLHASTWRTAPARLQL